MQLRIRTLLVTSFLLVAAFTPVFAYVIYDAIQDTEQQSSEALDRSQNAVETVENVILLSDDIVKGFNDVKNLTEAGEYEEAEKRMQSLRETIHQFDQETQLLIFVLNETQANASDEIAELRETRDSILELRDSTWTQVRDRNTVSVDVIDRSEEELNDLPVAAAGASSAVLSIETDNLTSLTQDLRDLGQQSVFLGLLTLLIATVIGLLISFQISRPVRLLAEEADKIKEEDFETVDISRISTLIVEFEELKQAMENVVLALKAEFGREREAMNRLALELTETLAQEMPRGVAESSLISACNAENIDPTDLQPEDVPDILSRLKLLTKGLEVDEKIFTELEDRAEEIKEGQ